MDVNRFLEGASNQVKDNFESQAKNRTWGLERENQAVLPNGAIPEGRKHQETLSNEAQNYGFLIVDSSSDPRSPRNMPKELEMDPEALARWAKTRGLNYDVSGRNSEGPNPVTDVDLWNQVELGTSAWEDFAGMLGEAEAMYYAAENSLPDDLVFNNKAVSDSLTYDDPGLGMVLGDADQPYEFIEEFFGEISDKGRYIDYVKFFGPGVLLNGLTGSTQLSGQPKRVFDDIEENVSQYVVGDGERPGIMALKPIQRIPFANSLLLDENGDKETIMGRKKVWDLTPSTSPVLSKEEGQMRHGLHMEYFDRADQNEDYGIGFDDFLGILAERDLVFTAGVNEDNLEYLDDGPELYRRFEHLNEGADYNIIVMSPERDPASTQTLEELIEAQRVEGMVSVEHPKTGEIHEVPVRADYSDQDAEEFYETAWNNTLVQESTNWPYDRLRMDGWFEDRVECDSEYWDLAAIHSGVWKQKWLDLQEAAGELGVRNEHAETIEEMAYNRGESYQLAQDFYEETRDIHYEGAKELVGRAKADEYIEELENSMYGEGTPATREFHRIKQEATP